MTTHGPGSERERAIATVGQCERQLWRAQACVRSADEMLRRAVRTAENAVGELRDATRRLDRLALRYAVRGTPHPPATFPPRTPVVE
jgi:hypothetical protein